MYFEVTTFNICICNPRSIIWCPLSSNPYLSTSCRKNLLYKNTSINNCIANDCKSRVHTNQPHRLALCLWSVSVAVWRPSSLCASRSSSDPLSQALSQNHNPTSRLADDFLLDTFLTLVFVNDPLPKVSADCILVGF